MPATIQAAPPPPPPGGDCAQICREPGAQDYRKQPDGRMTAGDIEATIGSLEGLARECRSRQLACVEGWPK